MEASHEWPILSKTPPVPEGRLDLSEVALLTGGGDRPYALGLATSLVEAGIRLDFIGSDFLDCTELRQQPLVRFLNLRGDNSPGAPLWQKVNRVGHYYVRLLRYAATAEPKVFHILWNNKIELFDRTLLMLYYRLLGKRIVYTVHNVNAAQRDGQDSALNRLTLRVQYHLVHHLFVHTERMKQQMEAEFSVPSDKISVIPFGINNTVPVTALTRADARERLGIGSADKCVLFFGNIAPYKGLEYLVEAMELVLSRVSDCRLVIAGRPKGSEAYWEAIDKRIDSSPLSERVIKRIEYVPDEDTEIFFKAADVLVLPYTLVFQSGVLFLGYSFGLPVIASDIASLKDDIIEEVTGYACPPADPRALAAMIERYFASDLYRELDRRRGEIQRSAAERNSWTKVASITTRAYRSV
jgi:glycosyltransferase involved in cell wall biosynthesis